LTRASPAGRLTVATEITTFADAGKPDVVTTKLAGEPTANWALEALVIAGVAIRA
jgi:hypothetical protein